MPVIMIHANVTSGYFTFWSRNKLEKNESMAHGQTLFYRLNDTQTFHNHITFMHSDRNHIVPRETLVRLA